MSAKVTEEMLREAAERYNQMNGVRAAGRFYFVRKKANGDGTFSHALDYSVGNRVLP
jgi:hypothetical protein